MSSNAHKVDNKLEYRNEYGTCFQELAQGADVSKHQRGHLYFPILEVPSLSKI